MMPNANDHIQQAQHNETFFRFVDQSQYSDWAMTALFYAALHYIDAFLSQVGMNPGGHDDRDKEVANRKELRLIARQYFGLKNRSRNARYYCIKFTPQQLQEASGSFLSTIKRSLGPHIGI
jgi:hypothetical protein